MQSTEQAGTADCVGVVGLGLLGSAIARRLIAGGYRVVGWDIESERRDAFAAAGGVPVTKLAELSAQAKQIVLSLPNSDVVTQVAEELATHAEPGTLIVDTTTGDPTTTEELGKRLAAHRMRYVDATVAGSSNQADRGEVAVMIGGEPAAVEAAQPLIDTFARQTFRVGDCGAGARMKLVVNLVLGLNRAVLAEGLVFARAIGVDPDQALRILQAGPAASAVMETKGRKMLSGDFQPQARLAQHLKDVRLILQQAENRSLPLPLSELHASLLERLIAAGFGDFDNSAIIRALDLPTGPE